MQSYPSIAAFNDRRHQHLIGKPCYIYNKYDGSNIRFEMKERELVKIGTRTRLMDENDPVFGPAVPAFLEKIHDYLSRTNTYLDAKLRQNSKRNVYFCEWHGPNSFAGSHDPNDQMTLTLIDLHVGNHGFIKPNLFHKMFQGTSKVAEMLYGGYLVPELISEVRTQTGVFESGLTEGVVIRINTNGDWETIKVKTNAWLERVKAKYGQDWEQYA